MLTAKGKYSLKALTHLAALEPGETTQAIEIAEANNIPKKFLDAILTDLRRAGLVYSKKGKGGGYTLARPAREISVGTIEGPFIGMLIFIVLREFLADYGTYYLILLGLIAIGVMLKAPMGIWGWVIHRYGLQLFPVSRRLTLASSEELPSQEGAAA